MTKVTKTSLIFISIIMATILTLTTLPLFVSAEPLSVPNTTIDHSGYTYDIPVSNNILNTDLFSSWVAREFLTEIPSALDNNDGIKICFTGKNAYAMTGLNIKYYLDGLSLKLKPTLPENGTGNIAFSLNLMSNLSDNSITYLTITLNGANGTVAVAKKDGNGPSKTIISTFSNQNNADFLKTANIKDKFIYFDFSRRKDGTGNYNIGVTVDGGSGSYKTVWGIIPKSIIDATASKTEHEIYTYVEISPVNNIVTNIEFYGACGKSDIHTEDNYSYVVPKISATDSDSTGNLRLSAAKMVSWWSSFLGSVTPSNLADGGGVRFNFVQEGNITPNTNVANAINQKFPLDGLSVKVANVGDGTDNSQHFQINLGSSIDYASGGAYLRIGVNARLGCIIAKRSDQNGDDQYSIIGEWMASSSNPNNITIKDGFKVKDQAVYFDFAKAKDDTGNYELFVTINGEVLKGTIPADIINGCNFANDKMCYVAVAGYAVNNGTTTSIDFLGVGNSIGYSNNTMSYNFIDDSSLTAFDKYINQSSGYAKNEYLTSGAGEIYVNNGFDSANMAISASSISPKNVRLANFETTVNFRTVGDADWGRGIGIGLRESWSGKHGIDFASTNSNKLSAYGVQGDNSNSIYIYVENNKAQVRVTTHIAGQQKGYIDLDTNATFKDGSYSIKAKALGDKLTVSVLKDNEKIVGTATYDIPDTVNASGAVSYYLSNDKKAYISNISLTALDVEGNSAPIINYLDNDIDLDGDVDMADVNEQRSVLLGLQGFKNGMDAKADLTFDLRDLVALKKNIS